MYQRTKYLFDPKSKSPFKISRSKIELFVQCPRCFYLDLRHGLKRPSWPAFTLNSAVDALLKKEFDTHRAGNTAHPLMAAYKLNYRPFAHSKMDQWRHNFTGVQVKHEVTNFMVYGAVDDIWQDDEGNLMIVDYKSTSTDKPIDLNDHWKAAYKRQMEFYQWLARHNEELGKYRVLDLGYFVYCNGQKDVAAFDAKLEFNIELIPYEGNDAWVEDKILSAHQCLSNDKIPEAVADCEYCQYRQAAKTLEMWGGDSLFS
ncbi:MAG: PD-(D/E)XK nuclease family protein [Patescibacteria group bacterium]